MTGWTELRDWSREVAGVDLAAQQVTALQAYVDLLLLWNRKVALVSQQGVDDILVKHVADSLVAAAHCGAARTIADLGSGGGFPGVVIGIVHPEARVCLMESRGKKASFLEEVCRRLPLRKCSVYHGRIEAAGVSPGHCGAYDLIVTRALADVDALRALAAPLMAPTGRLLAMVSSTMTPGALSVVGYRLPDGSPRQLAFLSTDGIATPRRI